MISDVKKQKVKQSMQKKKDRVTSQQRARNQQIKEHLFRGKPASNETNTGLFQGGNDSNNNNNNNITESHVPFIPSNFSRSNNFLSKLSQQPNYVDVFQPACKVKFLYLRQTSVDSAYDLEIVSHQTISDSREKLREKEEEEKKEAETGTLSNIPAATTKHGKQKKTKKNTPLDLEAALNNLEKLQQSASYIIFSKNGLTFNTYNGKETSFTTLQAFEREYNIYLSIISIPFFAKYRIWKNFTTWRDEVRSKKR